MGEEPDLDDVVSDSFLPQPSQPLRPYDAYARPMPARAQYIPPRRTLDFRSRHYVSRSQNH